MSKEKDCKNCFNCDFVWGFMATCHYSYDDDSGHCQVGQDIHRKTANKCKYYTEKEYSRDKMFVL